MNAPFRAANTSRRRFMVGAALTGGALVVGAVEARAQALGAAGAGLKGAAGKTGVGAFGPFVKIKPTGDVVVVNKHLEMGQGNHVGVAALVAEELDADWSRVSVEHAPANDKLYRNTALGIQGTGGSSAIANSFMQLRTAGAAARAMLVMAAAQRWKVPVEQITVKDSVVSHAASGRKAGFGELVAGAARIAPPQKPAMKSAERFTLIGSERMRRKDTGLKTTGKAIYTQDVQTPGLVVAMVAHSPRFGGKVAGYDPTSAKQVKGVIEVVQIPSGVAVLAETTHAARKGRDALKVTWNDSAAETRGSVEIMAEYHRIAAGQSDLAGVPFQNKGEAQGAFSGEVFQTSYDFPYLAHAAMEPMNCTIVVGADRARMTYGCQGQGWDQPNVAKALEMAPENIEIETLYAGGSFGRRSNLTSDYAVECAEVAKAAALWSPPLRGRPVKLVWTREDDMTAGMYRPMVHHALTIKTDADGYPLAWRHRIVSQRIFSFPGTKYDSMAAEGVEGSPYLKATPVTDTLVYHPVSPVPVSFWRSVGATHTAMVMEHTIDQLARRAGKDPVAYRRELYRRAGAERHLKVLDLAIARSDWGKPAPAGWTRTIAVHESFGTVVAQVADVTVVNGEPRVGKVVSAVDCGMAITPDQIRAQMEGAVCYGLSGVLFGQITLKGGIPEQRNFDSYRVLRFDEAPTVATYVLPSTTPPSGIGEPGTPLMGPLVAAALLQTTGKPTTSLPFVKA
jgi:isoquinoline 1-oxidoreductase beta subunit